MSRRDSIRSAGPAATRQFNLYPRGVGDEDLVIADLAAVADLLGEETSASSISLDLLPSIETPKRIGRTKLRPVGRLERRRVP